MNCITPFVVGIRQGFNQKNKQAFKRGIFEVLTYLRVCLAADEAGLLLDADNGNILVKREHDYELAL